MEDEFTIRLTIAGEYYPLKIKRSEEELVRKAARLVDERLAKYMGRFKAKSDDVKLDKKDFLAMIAFQFSLEYLKLNETHGVDSLTDSIQAIDTELDSYLQNK